RAETFSEIGRIYESDLGERDQALVGFTQAIVELPNDTTHLVRLEQIAGGDERAWRDVLAFLEEATRGAALAPRPKQAILLRMATCDQTKLARFDLATRCLEEVLDSDPTNDAALAKLSDIARRSQQWRQLGALLSRRAEGAPAPLARDLKTEAAELLERQL